MNLIILTCRNNVALSRACLPTLLNQHVPVNVLIADHASSDGTASWARSVAARDPRIFRLTKREHTSVAALWNESLRWAWEHGCGRALVVNADTELMPQTFEVLRLFTLPLWDKGTPSDPGMATCVSVRERERLIEPNRFDDRPHPDFSCFMIARWAWEEIGGFDENFHGAFFEDNSAHVEMYRRGIRAINTGLPFLHHGSMTIKNADRSEQKRISEQAELNRQYFFSKYGCYP